jgi:hypothetical protein
MLIVIKWRTIEEPGETTGELSDLLRLTFPNNTDPPSEFPEFASILLIPVLISF